LRGEVAFKVVDDAGHPTGEKFEAATEGADHKGIEAVVTRKDLSPEVVGLVRLFAKKDGVDSRAVEKHDPVSGEFRVEDGDKVDVVRLGGGFPFGPDPDRIETAGKGAVALFLMEKIVKVLEGGDQFTGGGFMGEILDGVADGQHRLMVKEVVDIGGRNGLGLVALGRPALFRNPHGAVVFNLEIRLQAALEAAV